MQHKEAHCVGIKKGFGMARLTHHSTRHSGYDAGGTVQNDGDGDHNGRGGGGRWAKKAAEDTGCTVQDGDSAGNNGN